jgi:putative transposase
MAGKKRHATAEIAAKLLDADALAKNGQPQAKIAKALGISVMTLHRWRKMRERQAPSVPAEQVPFLDQVTGGPSPSAAESLSRIAQLQIENARLRKLVTDLLLEKMRLEDDQQKLRRTLKSKVAKTTGVVGYNLQRRRNR